MVFTTHEGYPGDDVLCPCDKEFIEWCSINDITNKNVFHMGPGLHHKVGKALCVDGNFVDAITISPDEVHSYMEGVISGELSSLYRVWFSDIHDVRKEHIFPYDIVTLFHLGETNFEDADVLDVISTFWGASAPSALIVAYTHSAAWGRVEHLFESYLNRVEQYKNLRFYS